MSKRTSFSELEYGWNWDDGTFEPETMPLEWRSDYRGFQIEDSRRRAHRPVREEFKLKPLYSAGARHLSREEKLAPVRRYVPSVGAEVIGEAPSEALELSAPDHLAMGAGQMLESVGDDASKWADAFVQTAQSRLDAGGDAREMLLDTGWMLGWFANAIEHSTAVRAARYGRELETENFALAADQCHHGYGDEHGHHRCIYQDQIEDLKAEIARLMAANPPAILVGPILETPSPTEDQEKRT
jgi:hypothetical protein